MKEVFKRPNGVLEVTRSLSDPALIRMFLAQSERKRDDVCWSVWYDSSSRDTLVGSQIIKVHQNWNPLRPQFPAACVEETGAPPH